LKNRKQRVQNLIVLVSQSHLVKIKERLQIAWKIAIQSYSQPRQYHESENCGREHKNRSRDETRQQFHEDNCDANYVIPASHFRVQLLRNQLLRPRYQRPQPAEFCSLQYMVGICCDYGTIGFIDVWSLGLVDEMVRKAKAEHGALRTCVC
jgi:hypothetical protein